MQDFLTKKYVEKDIIYIGGHPLPPAFPIRPFHALRSAWALKNDNEDTAKVYDVTNSFSGSVHIRKFEQFLATDYGRRVIEGNVKIGELLCDRERLAAMPVGSVGRAFYEFMESENLSEHALLDAVKETGIDYTVPGRFEGFCRQVIHFKVTHDLWHILSGYHRDSLGEICLLKFYNGQWYDRGVELIVKIGSFAENRKLSGSSMRALLTEAHENARAAKWIMGVDIENYIEKPLDEARDMLAIRPPDLYRSIALREAC